MPDAVDITTSPRPPSGGMLRVTRVSSEKAAATKVFLLLQVATLLSSLCAFTFALTSFLPRLAAAVFSSVPAPPPTRGIPQRLTDSGKSAFA